MRAISNLVPFVLAVGLVACGGGSGKLNPPGRGFNSGGSAVETGQATVTVTPGPPVAAAITWSNAFADTNYTAVCTPKLVSGGNTDLSVLIQSKSTTGMQALVQFNDNGTVQVNCIAIADATSSDIRHARASFTSPGSDQTSTEALSWNSSFPDTSYTAVCSPVAVLETVPVTEHIHAITPSQVTSTVHYVTSAAKPFEIDCIGVPDQTTSGVRHGRSDIAQSLGVPVTVFVNWDTAFSDSNYVAACDTLFLSGTENSIVTNATGTTVSTQTVAVHWPTTTGSGRVGCIAAHP